MELNTQALSNRARQINRIRWSGYITPVLEAELLNIHQQLADWRDEQIAKSMAEDHDES